MGRIRANPEKDLQRSILEWLKIKYPMIMAWKVNSAATYSLQKKTFLKPDKYTIKGVADICGIFPCGVWLAIEVKIKPNKPTPEQVSFLKMIGERGGVGIVAFSLEDIEDLLGQAIKTSPALLHSPGLFFQEETNQPRPLREEMS